MVLENPKYELTKTERLNLMLREQVEIHKKIN